MNGMNQTNNPWDISLYSLIPDKMLTGLTPSTGDVRALVLPIEFSNNTFSQKQLEDIEANFFGENDTNIISNLSVKDAYNRLSYGKLNISGDVLPVYRASEENEYYTTMKLWNGLIEEAIKSYQDIDFSLYDGNEDGYIDIFFVEYPSSPNQISDDNVWGSYVIRSNIDLPDGMQITQRAQTFKAKQNGINAITEIHEIGHLLGLPDNYYVDGMQCIIDGNIHEIMSSGGAKNVILTCIINIYWNG